MSQITVRKKMRLLLARGVDLFASHSPYAILDVDEVILIACYRHLLEADTRGRLPLLPGSSDLGHSGIVCGRGKYTPSI